MHGKHILDSVSWVRKKPNPFMHLAKNVPLGTRSCETLVEEHLLIAALQNVAPPPKRMIPQFTINFNSKYRW